MALTAIEIMALFVAVLTLVKIISISINLKGWMKFANSIYGNPRVTFIVSLILSVGALHYLLQKFTIVDIFAIMFFFMFVMLMSVSIYSKEMMDMAKKLMKTKGIIKKSWFIILIWVVLSIWVLYTIFA